MKKFDIKGKRVLITGANTGIGRETACALASQGAEVIMACRNLEKAAAACTQMEETSCADIGLMYLDLANQSAIRSFCEFFSARYKHIDILINNAGVFMRNKQKTTDGYEMTMGVNYFGTVLLTELLLPMLKNAEGEKRVINLSSGAYYGGKVKPSIAHLNSHRNFPAYAASKQALMYYSFELAERLKDDDITVNTVNPGHSATDIFPSDKWYWRIVNKMVNKRAASPEQAAKTSIFAATSNALCGVTGKYLEDEKITPVKEDVFSADVQKKLWEVTQQSLCID